MSPLSFNDSRTGASPHEKAFHHVPRGILLAFCGIRYGVQGALLRAVRSLYDRSRSLVRIVRNKAAFCHRRGKEGVWFRDHKISSLLFADDIVLLASSGLDLQHALGWFAVECDMVGMKISTSKFEAMVLDWKRAACVLQVGGEFLPPVEELKRIGAAAAAMRSMYRSVVVKKEPSQKVKLSIYRSIYVPTLTYGHDRKDKAAKISFLLRVAGHTLRDR
ncbi:hypothetical protein M9458_053786, partial [Cirrhinus mrigala]